jgi:hypothetical protein
MGRISAVTRSYLFFVKEYYHIRKQTRYRISKEISKGEPDIKPLLRNNKVHHRIEQYINFCQLLGQTVCALYGRKMSAQEEIRFFQLSLLGPVFDDFFDKDNLSHGTIKLMIRQPELHKPGSDIENIFIQYLRRIYLSLSNPDPFRNACLKLHDAQIESLRQNDPDLPINEIQCISMDKGGISGILYRHLLDEPLKDGEIGAIYQLGTLGQFVDDIFDYYDDWKDGIRNAANCLNNQTLLKIQFKQAVNETVIRFRHLDYPTENINELLSLLNILISPVWLCLDRFDDLTFKYGERINPEHIQRSEMICDMEKWINRLSLYFKSINHYSTIVHN